MRIRQYPAVGFAVIILSAAYLGLTPSTIPSYKQSDKVLHFLTFFLLTLCFYWMLETNRRRNLQLSLLVCTAALGIGSEVIQALLPNGREFDSFDIFANITGSLAAIALSMWYHKRMLERKRKAKTFDFGAGEEDGIGLERDVELGEVEVGVGGSGGGHGEVDDDGGGGGGETMGAAAGHSHGQSLEEEVDNWDENADDWDEDGDEGPAAEAAESDTKGLDGKPAEDGSGGSPAAATMEKRND